MPKPKKHENTVHRRVTVPCSQLLNERQVSDRLGLTRAKLRDLDRRSVLTPARVMGLILYTLADVRRYESGSRERHIMELLNAGEHPCDISIEHGYHPAEVAKTLETWGKLAGYWIVEGPPGSYARWLERFGLLRCSPKLLRRLVELMLTDPYVQQKLRHRDVGKWVDRAPEGAK